MEQITSIILNIPTGVIHSEIHKKVRKYISCNGVFFVLDYLKNFEKNLITRKNLFKIKKIRNPNLIQLFFVLK
jgi:hypothetical protein